MPYDFISVYKKAYGCINVKVGDELKVAKVIMTRYPDVKAYAIMNMKHRRSNGVRSYSCDIMVPGYILFCAQADMPVSQLLTISSVIRVLKYDDCDWRLRGDDLNFSKWIFDNNGLIGMSIAFMESDQIRIVEGPLKQVEGKIVRVNKRSKNAMVQLGFKRQSLNVWLPFEWMEKSVNTYTANRAPVYTH